jgi:Ser/Thr protein kinase RdoA (MazF antagonist)
MGEKPQSQSETAATLGVCLFGKTFTRLDDLQKEQLAFRLAGPAIAPRPGPVVLTARPSEYIFTMQKLDRLKGGDSWDWKASSWSELGALLRRLHSVPVAGVGPLMSDIELPWHTFLHRYVTARCAAIELWSSDFVALAREGTSHVVAALPNLPQPDITTLVHRDIRPTNLGLCPESGGLRLFDFEHCWGGDGLYDIATLWMDAGLWRPEADAIQARQQFLAAYDPAFPQQAFDTVIGPTYALIRSIGAIAWGARNRDACVLNLGLEGVETWKKRLVV